MKFYYEYNTSDNEHRKGSIKAFSRDDAYARLKREGIKPSRVVLAPGVINKILSIGRRGLAIALLSALLGVTTILLYVSSYREKILRQENGIAQQMMGQSTRRQIIGDNVVITRGLRTGWDFVFPQQGDRFLASFAVPGYPAAVGSVMESDLAAVIDVSVPITENDTLEVRQIKTIVEGMKQEAREFLQDGGTLKEYGECLVRRQEEEMSIFARARKELSLAEQQMSDDDYMELWERRNEELARMGIRQIPMSEKKF